MRFIILRVVLFSFLIVAKITIKLYPNETNYVKIKARWHLANFIKQVKTDKAKKIIKKYYNLFGLLKN